jgi:flagellar motility protein MotE (MotC chaperone)
MSTSLAILTSKLEQLCDEVDDSDVIPSDLIERFASAQMEHAQKCDAYVAVIKGIQHNAAYYSMRAEQLNKRAKTCERIEKAIKERLLYMIQENPGITFKSTDGDKLAARDNQEALKHDIPVRSRSYSNIIEGSETFLASQDLLQFVDVVEFSCLNTAKVKEYLQAGKTLSWARLTRSQHLRLT